MTPLIPLSQELAIINAYVSYMQGIANAHEKQVLADATKNPQTLKFCQDLGAIWANREMREVLLLKPRSPLLSNMTQELLKSRPEEPTIKWIYWSILAIILMLLGLFIWYAAKHGPYLEVRV